MTQATKAGGPGLANECIMLIKTVKDAIPTSDVPLLTFLAPETLPIATGNLRPIFALAHQNSPALAFCRSFLI